MLNVSYSGNTLEQIRGIGIEFVKLAEKRERRLPPSPALLVLGIDYRREARQLKELANGA